MAYSTHFTKFVNTPTKVNQLVSFILLSPYKYSVNRFFIFSQNKTPQQVRSFVFIINSNISL